MKPNTTSTGTNATSKTMVCTFRLEGMPEVLAGMRAEFARLVRLMAEDETPAVAERLREVAAMFEAGVTDAV